MTGSLTVCPTFTPKTCPILQLQVARQAQVICNYKKLAEKKEKKNGIIVNKKLLPVQKCRVCLQWKGSVGEKSCLEKFNLVTDQVHRVQVLNCRMVRVNIAGSIHQKTGKIQLIAPCPWGGRQEKGKHQLKPDQRGGWKFIRWKKREGWKYISLEKRVNWKCIWWKIERIENTFGKKTSELKTHLGKC